MDRYVVREPRVGAEYPQGNQLNAFRGNPARNNTNMIPENMYFGGYAVEPPAHFYSEGYVGVQNRMNAAPFTPVNRHPSQGQMMSGIDPRYLASYSDNSAPFIISGQQMQEDRPIFQVSFGNDYENRSLVAPERSKTSNAFMPQAPTTTEVIKPNEILPPKTPFSEQFRIKTQNNNQYRENFGQGFQQKNLNVPSAKITTEIAPKEETQIHVLTRSEKIQALQKSGPRAFSGPIEKILKWHKSLQEIGVLVIYEIVAKCVSVRPGEGCAKNLVVRDDNGPAMQVVYYEIDFLLPELKPPCTVRVVGRMMAGTCRLQAFNVRLATGDDVATLPRRAAVAAHHVGKLCKEYGVKIN